MAGTAVTVYPITGEAPLLTGAVKLTMPVEETAKPVGAVELVLAANTTGLNAGEVPLAF